MKYEVTVTETVQVKYRLVVEAANEEDAVRAAEDAKSWENIVSDDLANVEYDVVLA